MNTTPKFTIGQVTTAQLGNPRERGYRPNCQVEVLAMKETFPGLFLYLIKPVGVEGFLASATETISEDILGELYATDGRSFGAGSSGEKFGFVTEDQARRSLGF